jgi:hypothetical protein
MSDDALGRPPVSTTDFRASSLLMAVLDFAGAAGLAGGRIVLTQPDVHMAPFAMEVACAGVALFLGLMLLRARAEIGGQLQWRYTVNAGFGALAAFGVCVSVFGVSLYFPDARGSATVLAISLAVVLCLATYFVCRKSLKSTR